MTKTTVNPKNLLEYENNKSDVMVHSKTNGFGKTMTSIAWLEQQAAWLLPMLH